MTGSNLLAKCRALDERAFHWKHIIICTQQPILPSPLALHRVSSQMLAQASTARR